MSAAGEGTEPAPAVESSGAQGDPPAKETHVGDVKAQELQDRQRGHERGGPLKEGFGLLVRAACWALAIYLLIFQVSVVKGQSMEPTLENDDRLVIDKVTFRFRDPQPGDIIVFEAVKLDGEPKDNTPGGESRRFVPKDFVKRVIAGPKSRVRIAYRERSEQGAVIVTGTVIVDGVTTEEFEEVNPLVRHPNQDEVFLVPDNRYFVMGDNRGNSNDSRSGLGFVSRNQIKGRVRCRIFPLGRARWF